MSGIGWADVLALLTSIGFGVVSAIVPVINAETYVIASQMSAVAGPVPIAIGIGIGQTIGKLLLFIGVRRGQEFAIVRRWREAKQPRPVGPVRTKFRAIVAKLLALVGQKRWGLPIVGIAAVAGIPPLYAVALLAGATTMRTILFALTVLAGRTIRFVLVALGITGLHDWFI